MKEGLWEATFILIYLGVLVIHSLLPFYENTTFYLLIIIMLGVQLPYAINNIIRIFIKKDKLKLSKLFIPLPAIQIMLIFKYYDAKSFNYSDLGFLIYEIIFTILFYYAFCLTDNKKLM